MLGFWTIHASAGRHGLRWCVLAIADLPEGGRIEVIRDYLSSRRMAMSRARRLASEDGRLGFRAPG